MRGDVIMFYVIVIGVIGFYVKFKKSARSKELQRIRKMSQAQKQLEMIRLQTQMADYRTSHVLHFFMCIPTFGFWLFVWAMCTWSNSTQRREIEDLMRETVESEAGLNKSA